MKDIDKIAAESDRIASMLKSEFADLIRKHDPKIASTAMIDASIASLAMALVAIDAPYRDVVLAQISKEIDRRMREYAVSWDSFLAGANSVRKRMEDGE